MKWKVSYSKEAKNFIETHNIWNEARNGIRKFFQKMKGEDVNINLKKLVGNWEGYCPAPLYLKIISSNKQKPFLCTIAAKYKNLVAHLLKHRIGIISYFKKNLPAMIHNPACDVI